MSSAPIDAGHLRPVAELTTDGDFSAEQYQQLTESALNYITQFEWCERVIAAFAGLAIPGVVGVFLVNIEPTNPDVDPWLWLIVGDIPPAYLVTDDAPSPRRALELYVEEMRLWTAAAHAGHDVSELIPVNVEPTSANAANLDRRLAFLAEKVAPEASA
jgi:hypothetical protein